MATRRFTDPLSMDMTNDLERVDGVMTQILKDRATWSEFLQDPNGVFVRLGLHPPTTSEINERVNRVFYAALTNKKLLLLLSEHYKDFQPSKKKSYRDQFVANLKKGVIQHSIELDHEGVQHLLRKPETLRQMLGLTLHDLNRKGILQKRHKRKEVDDYIESVIAAVRARQPIESHPKLEVWDRNYGIGQPFGGSFVEVGSVVTAATSVEAAAVVTAVATAVAFVNVEVVIDGSDVLVALQADATQGDKESIRAVAILGRLLDLSGEVLVHAHNFETRLP